MPGIYWTDLELGIVRPPRVATRGRSEGQGPTDSHPVASVHAARAQDRPAGESLFYVLLRTCRKNPCGTSFIVGLVILVVIGVGFWIRAAHRS